MSDTRIVESQSLSWAQETTLKRLAKEVEVQTGILEKIAGLKGDTVKAARETTERLEGLGESAVDTADALDDATRAARKAEAEAKRSESRSRDDARKRREDQYERERREYQYRQSLNELRNSLNAVSTATPASLWSKMGDQLAVTGGNMSAAGGASSMLGRSLTMLSRVVAGVSFAFGAYAGIAEPFKQMVDSGLLFGGSAERFAQAAYRSGTSLEVFTRLAGQYSETVAAIGEQTYARNLRTMQDLARPMGFFGMGAEAFNESVTQYSDQLREIGLLQYMRQEDLNTVTMDYLKNLTAVSVLQGRSRRALEQEQRAASNRARIQLRIETVRRTEGETAAANLTNRYNDLVNQIGETAATAAFMQQEYGAVTQEGARLLAPTGLMEYLPNLRSSEAEYQAQLQRFGQRREAIDPGVLMAYGLSEGIGGRLGTAATQLAQLGNRLRPLTSPAQDAERRRQEAESARRGESVVDRTMQNYLNLQLDTARAIGDLKASAIEAARSLGVFSTLMSAAATAAAGASATTNALYGMVSSGIGGAAAGAGLGLAGFLGLRRLINGRSASGLAGLPTMGALGGAPAVPGIPGTAGRSLLGMTGGRALGGAGLGLAGAGLGALASGAGYGMLGNTLSGAGMGAGLGMIAGPWGAALGGILGGAAGALGLLGGGEATPTVATPVPDMTVSMTRINTTLTDHLGPGGTIENKLEDLRREIALIGGNIVRAVRESN